MKSRTAHVPFLPPLAAKPIVLDLPVPPSVNRTRKVDWRARSATARWLAQADALVMSQGRLPPAIIGPWEMSITMSESLWRIDPDNGLKCLIDFFRRISLIENDSPRFARRIVLQWGDAPEGVRVEIRAAT
jgi:Holliday junction resolvase RusA-like endonuclease